MIEAGGVAVCIGGDETALNKGPPFLLYDTGVGECVIVDGVGRDVFVGPRFPASVNDGCCT